MARDEPNPAKKRYEMTRPTPWDTTGARTAGFVVSVSPQFGTDQPADETTQAREK